MVIARSKSLIGCCTILKIYDSRVHGHTTHGRPDSQPTGTAGLSEITVFPQRVADLANGSTAVAQDFAHFSTLQADLRVTTAFFMGNDLAVGSGRTDKNTRAIRAERNGVDNSAGRNEVKRKDISWLESKRAKETKSQRLV